jgi:hypothetical protein
MLCINCIDNLFLKEKNIKPFLSATPNYTQRIETKITVPTLYTSGPRVKNVKIIHY